VDSTVAGTQPKSSLKKSISSAGESALICAAVKSLLGSDAPGQMGDLDSEDGVVGGYKMVARIDAASDN
jgi:hypothetical protein